MEGVAQAAQGGLPARGPGRGDAEKADALEGLAAEVEGAEDPEGRADLPEGLVRAALALVEDGRPLELPLTGQDLGRASDATRRNDTRRRAGRFRFAAQGRDRTPQAFARGNGTRVERCQVRGQKRGVLAEILHQRDHSGR